MLRHTAHHILILLLILTVACSTGDTPHLSRQTPTPVGSRPISGTAVPQLAAFDHAMQDFMTRYDIGAGTLAVMKHGVIVLERGYGWQDRQRTQPLPPNALLRIASVTKPITAAAIKHLARDGKLAPTDKVFCLPETVGPCHLKIPPFGTPDPRVRDITIQHVFDHRGGWDREVSGDPMFQAIEIAAKLGIASPPSKQDTVRYMLGKPLDFAPGTTPIIDGYSNFGYMVLGLVIEQVTQQTYTTYIQDAILNPLGVPDSEIALGRTLPQFRNPREPWYHHEPEQYNHEPKRGPCVFSPYQPVLWPDGGFHLEAMEAHGGMIGSGRALLTFMRSYWLDGAQRAGEQRDVSRDGRLAGTLTIVSQRADGVEFVALLNQGYSRGWLRGDEIKAVLDEAANHVTQWPTTEVPAAPIPSAGPSTPVPTMPPSCASTSTPTPTLTLMSTHTMTPSVRPLVHRLLPQLLHQRQ